MKFLKPSFFLAAAILFSAIIVTSNLYAAKGTPVESKIIVERVPVSGQKAQTETIANGDTLKLLKGECVSIYGTDGKGKKVLLMLTLTESNFRVNLTKKAADAWELCGQYVSFTEAETKIRYRMPGAPDAGKPGKKVQGIFTVVVEPESVKFDKVRAGEGTVSLYWGILQRFPGDPNQSGNEAFAAARSIENDNMVGYVQNAEQMAKSDEFKQKIMTKMSAEELVDNFYWRFLGVAKAPRDAHFNTWVNWVKQGKAHLVVADIVSSKEYAERIRKNDFFRGK